jgi:hypothetical protein
LETSPPKSPKLRQLRVFNLLATVAGYCVRNAGWLIGLIWFPCVLLVASQVTVDWLALEYPPRLPEWLLTPNYNPPTWLMPIVNALWVAMATAFILSGMTDRSSSRGLMPARILRPARVRFELSRDVLLAAATFAIAYLLDGVLRVLELKILVAAYLAFDLSDETVYGWGRLVESVHVPIMAAMYTFSNLVAGRVLLSGTFDLGYTWKLTRGNRLRLFAIFLLLTVAATAIDQLAAPATAWLAQSLAGPVRWTLSSSVIRFLADLPLFMLWTVVDAVTIRIVLDVLEPRTASIFD